MLDVQRQPRSIPLALALAVALVSTKAPQRVLPVEKRGEVCVRREARMARNKGQKQTQTEMRELAAISFRLRPWTVKELEKTYV